MGCCWSSRNWRVPSGHQSSVAYYYKTTILNYVTGQDSSPFYLCNKKLKAITWKCYHISTKWYLMERREGKRKDTGVLSTQEAAASRVGTQLSALRRIKPRLVNSITWPSGMSAIIPLRIRASRFSNHFCWFLCCCFSVFPIPLVQLGHWWRRRSHPGFCTYPTTYPEIHFFFFYPYKVKP